MKPIAIFTFLLLPFSAFSKNEVSPRQQEWLQKRSLCFIENKGQVADQHGNARPDIQYKVRATKGLSVFIGNGQIHYQFFKPHKKQSVNDHKLSNGDCSDPVLFDTYRLDVALEGANPQALAVTDEKQDYYEHYHTARLNDHNARINTYGRITYKDVYPNIDWVLYIKGNQLEYDFVIRPGGDATNIKIRYDGASELKESADAVTAITPFGSVTESKLYTYRKESGKRVTANFLLNKNTLGFNVGHYNETIVIDPTLVWSTYFGGNQTDVAQGIVYDGNNGIYIGGTTQSGADLATTGAHQGVYGGANDAFVARFTTGGALRWATYFGGPGDENGFDVAADARGNVLITGSTTSDTNIATSGVYDTVYAGASDGFLAKFDSSGVLRWGTYIGGNSVDIAYGVGCGDSNTVYIAGSSNSTFAVTTFFAYQTILGSVKDAFLAKFDSTGKIRWSTYYGGNRDDIANDVAFSNGKVYLTGTTESTNQVATPGAHQAAGGGTQTDVFLAQFSSGGVLNWATYFGGSAHDQGLKVAADSNSIYIAGSTSSTDSIAAVGASQSALGGLLDGYLAKFNNTGTRVWSTYYGGSHQDLILGLCSNNVGDICITGQTMSVNNIATPGEYHTAPIGGIDAFAAKFSKTGSRLWGTYFGGSDADWSFGVACDDSDNVYITGQTLSNDSIATTGSYRTNIHGAADVFLTKFNAPVLVTTAELHLGGTEGVAHVWPNPVKDKLYCEASMAFLHGSVTITDITGKQMITQAMNIGNITEINVADLSPGIYLYQVSDNNVRKHTGKFIKE